MLVNDNNEEKSYQCTCGLTFGKYQNMSSHKDGCKDYLQSIGKQFEFICDQCGQAFGNYGALGAHIKFKHEQYKPKEKEKEKCSICGKILTKNNIKNHMNKHSNPNASFEVKERYKLDHDDLFCKFCGKECKNKNSLVQHEMRCEQNDSRISIQGNYINPFLTCCGEFYCTYCGKKYIQKGSCKSHEGVCALNPNGEKELKRRIDLYISTHIIETTNQECIKISHTHTQKRLKNSLVKKRVSL